MYASHADDTGIYVGAYNENKYKHYTHHNI